MFNITRHLTTIAGLTLLAATSVACGSDSVSTGSGDGQKKPDAATETFSKQSAKEIIEQTGATMKGLKSLRLRGSVTESEGKLKLDLAIDTDGNCKGSISVDDGTAKIVVIGEELYMKGDEEFWIFTLDEERGAKLNRMIGDRWVKLPRAASDFSEFCDLDSFLDELDDDMDADTAADGTTKGDVVSTDAGEAIKMIATDDDGTTTALVSTSNPHYILEVSMDVGDEPGSFTLTDFDEPVKARAPAAKDVVDMTSTLES